MYVQARAAATIRRSAYARARAAHRLTGAPIPGRRGWPLEATRCPPVAEMSMLDPARWKIRETYPPVRLASASR